MAVKSTELVVPCTPDGDQRRPLTSTRVRWAPRPRSETLAAPGPPSVRKPWKASLICSPEAAVEPRRISSVLTRPARAERSEVMISTGDAVSKLLRRMREPVTTTSSAVDSSVVASVSSFFAGSVWAGWAGAAVADWARAACGAIATMAAEANRLSQACSLRFILELPRRCASWPWPRRAWSNLGILRTVGLPRQTALERWRGCPTVAFKRQCEPRCPAP